MGDKTWYVCLKCMSLRCLTEDEANEFMHLHWGHLFLYAGFDAEGEFWVEVLEGEP